VSHRAIAAGAALVLLATTVAAPALARNPNCAGGIQYVVQGMRDKDKGNLEDYKREMLKAVDRLSMCAVEDSVDYEALAYLGWAYAEMDSACPAGQAFEKAITGLKEKDPKKVNWAQSNRESYWAKYFNKGVADIQAAQATYDPFPKEPADESEKTLKAEAKGKYESAITSLERAGCLKPGDPRTARNMGTAYALMGDLVKAEAVLRAGLAVAPADTDLVDALATVRRNYAGKLLDEQQFDQAIAFYSDLLKSNATDADLNSGLANAYFQRAGHKDGDARKADYKASGEAYARAAAIKNGESDLVFNAALSFQNAGDFAQAETNWREFLKGKPDDMSALSAFGATLAEEKKLDEAAAALHRAVMLAGKDNVEDAKRYHMQLAGVYSRADNQPKSYEEMMVFLSLQRGAPAQDPAEAAKRSPAGSDAAKLLAKEGVPEQVWYWQGDTAAQKYETWFYWSKHLAYSFSGGQQLVKSDWGAPPPRLTAPASTATPGKTVVGKKR
jgi:tetratricopeptide (TPR) repeat protein